MMDQEVQLQPYDVDLEDGEISDSSDIYTPLPRPPAVASNSTATAADVVEERSPLATCHQMQTALEDEASQVDSSNDSSSGSSSSEACLKKITPEGVGGTKDQRKRRKRVRRTVMVRVQSADSEAQEKRTRFKKYNIWTAALQEDALTENMRGCDVTRNSNNDRNVEYYDYTLQYRLNGENSLKRRLSNSTDDFSDGGELPPSSKRGRPSRVSNDAHSRRTVKSRLGHRVRGRRGSTPTSGSDNSYDRPKHILDLDDPTGRDPLDVAREMASKLAEEKDELMVRIVEVLGTELPMEIYKETQRIEADGGMMIKNGMRRRTPGGVFLFLLKNHERLTAEEQKIIFTQERQNLNKWLKEAKSMSRDRKVEELKKRLSEKDKRLAAFSARKDNLLLGSDLSLEHQTTSLSNPPPSPVGQEQSPDYKTHAINHVISAPDASPEKATTSAAALESTLTPVKDIVGYDDDFLDINCGEMDMF